MNKGMNADGSKLAEQLGFRPTQEDTRYIGIIADRLRTARGAAFVNRTECLRAALKVAAEAAQQGAPI